MQKKLPNLDPLRFFLAFMVILHHIPSTMGRMGFNFDYSAAIFHKGGEAVEFFFTLSGFLIIRLLYIEKLNFSNIRISDFYIRRILRIYPLYYLVLITGILIYHAVLPAAHIGKPTDYNLGDLLLYYIFLLPNVFAGKYAVGSILNILWSIGIEEQFYLFIPLIVFFIPRRYFIKGLLLLLGGYLMIYFQTRWLITYEFCYFYFLFGGAISVISYKYPLHGLFKYRILSILLLTCFILFFFTGYFYGPRPLDSGDIWGSGKMNVALFHKYIIEQCATMLLSGLFILMIAEYPLFIIKNKTLNYLGQISYGIYMYHMIVFTLLLFPVRYVFDLRPYSGNALMIGVIALEVALTTLVAHLSYKYYEAFFLRLKNRFRPKRKMEVEQD